MVVELEEPGRAPRRNMNAGGGMLCPVCELPLAMADRQGVEIDYCPQCRGVWLDRGELDKIIERTVGEMAPPPDRKPGRRGAPERDFDDRHDRSYRKGKHGRRKSWMHEMFDLFD